MALGPHRRAAVVLLLRGHFVERDLQHAEQLAAILQAMIPSAHPRRVTGQQLLRPVQAAPQIRYAHRATQEVICTQALEALAWVVEMSTTSTYSVKKRSNLLAFHCSERILQQVPPIVLIQP